MIFLALRPGRVKFAWNFPFFTPFLTWHFGEIFRRTPKPWKNVARKISPKFHAKFHDIFGREIRRKMSLPHFCRVAALMSFFRCFDLPLDQAFLVWWPCCLKQLHVRSSNPVAHVSGVCYDARESKEVRALRGRSALMKLRIQIRHSSVL